MIYQFKTRMKILLVVPPLLKTDRYGYELEKVGPTSEPLGLAYVAASLEKAGHDVTILDTLALNWDKYQVDNYLIENEFNLIGIQILTPMYLRFQEILKVIKKRAKNAIIVGGGPHVTIMSESCIKENPDIDFGVIGDGEDTIVELVDALEYGRDVSKVKGLIYEKNGKIIRTATRPFRTNIDEYPLPARHLLPMDKYMPTVTYYKHLPSFIILTSRGCPFHCTYCSKIAGNTVRQHSVDRVIKELEMLINIYGAKDIIFRDDTLTINKPFITDLCNEIIRKKIHKKIKWSCMTRVNCVTEDMLNLMKKAGCWSIHYGFESGSQRILDIIKKGIKLNQVRNAFKWTRKAGIEIKAFFMLGLPTETKEEALQTIKFAKEIDPDWVQFTITTPYPGTELYEQAKQNGTLKSFKWEDYQTWSGFRGNELVYVPEGWTSDELKATQPYALRQFYFRPKILLRIIFKIRSISILTRGIWGARAILKH
jgi:radical SAM superfamily enzyme YgiQ (UPF0313 family)